MTFDLKKYTRTSNHAWVYFYMLDNPLIDEGTRRLLLLEWRYSI